MEAVGDANAVRKNSLLDYYCTKLSNLWQNHPVFQYPLLALNSFENGISNIPNDIILIYKQQC